MQLLIEKFFKNCFMLLFFVANLLYQEGFITGLTFTLTNFVSSSNWTFSSPGKKDYAKVVCSPSGAFSLAFLYLHNFIWSSHIFTPASLLSHLLSNRSFFSTSRRTRISADCATNPSACTPDNSVVCLFTSHEPWPASVCPSLWSGACSRPWSPSLGDTNLVRRTEFSDLVVS